MGGHGDGAMRGFAYYDWGRIGYVEAWRRQREAFEGLLAAKAGGSCGKNCLFVCEHPSTVTLGKHGKAANLLVSEAALAAEGVALVHTDRGGDITYHGPGQLVVYPVFDLATWGMGLREYVHTLEEIVIRLLGLYGLVGERMAGAPGVWMEAGTAGKARKICAVGLRSSRYVTMHGLALNVDTDLRYFGLINPCGLVGRGVTSIAKELGARQGLSVAKARVRELFGEYFPGASA